MSIKEFCNVCKKSIDLKHHKALQCSCCKCWTHKKCNKLNDIDYNLQRNYIFWYCLICLDDLIYLFTVSKNPTSKRGYCCASFVC